MCIGCDLIAEILKTKFKKHWRTYLCIIISVYILRKGGLIIKPKEKHYDQKITFLVNSQTYLNFKIALLSLHKNDPEKYPAVNPSLAFRYLMQSTIEEFEKIGKEDEGKWFTNFMITGEEPLQQIFMQ